MISTCVMPAAQRLAAARARERAQLLVGRGARGGDRLADPAGGVRRAGHAGGELVAALAGEDEVGVAVDEARDDAAPGRVDAAVRAGAAARPRHRRDALAFEHDRRVADGAELGVVRDEQADVVDRERRVMARAPRAARGRRRSTRAAPSRTIQRPPTMTSRTSAAPAQNTVPSSGGVPASRTESSPTVVRSASAPGAMRPAVGQPEAGVAARRRRGQQLGGRVAPALAGGQALVELDRARLLEQVDHRVRVAAQREPGAARRRARGPGRCRRRGRARSSGTGRPWRPRRRAGRRRRPWGGWRGSR